jgi:hypothetical protein
MPKDQSFDCQLFNSSQPTKLFVFDTTNDSIRYRGKSKNDPESFREKNENSQQTYIGGYEDLSNPHIRTFLIGNYSKLSTTLFWLLVL